MFIWVKENEHLGNILVKNAQTKGSGKLQQCQPVHAWQYIIHQQAQLTLQISVKPIQLSADHANLSRAPVHAVRLFDAGIPDCCDIPLSTLAGPTIIKI